MSTPSELTARRVFVGLVILSLVGIVLVLTPFASAFFLAAVFGGALLPAHKWLTRKLRGRETISAGLLVATVVLVLLVPVGGLAAFVVKEASDGYRFVTETLRSEGVNGLVEALPDPVERIARQAMDRFNVATEDLTRGLNESVGEQVQTQGGAAVKTVTGAVAATGSLLVQAIFMLIALFFFLTDGERLVDWVEDVAPLKAGQTREILIEFRKVSVAVMFSSVATAAVQTVAAVIGYLIARVPNVLFFALVTFLVALIPAVGAASVVLAAALLLLVLGHPWFALFLAIWGVVVVGLVDNVVKPLLVKRGLSMHGAVVFFALLGGLAAFGTIGLLIGPMIVAFFLALVRIHQRDFGDKPRPATPVQPSSQPT